MKAFLNDKLNWGTSIRGAWFDCNYTVKIDCDRLIIERGEFENFIKQLIEWAKPL